MKLRCLMHKAFPKSLAVMDFEHRVIPDSCPNSLSPHHFTCVGRRLPSVYVSIVDSHPTPVAALIESVVYFFAVHLDSATAAD